MSFSKDFFLLSHHDGCRTGDDDGGFKWPNSLLLFKNIFCSGHMMMMRVILVVLDGLKTQNCNCHCFFKTYFAALVTTLTALALSLSRRSSALILMPTFISHALSSLLYHFGVTFDLFVKTEVFHICLCTSPPSI